MNLKLFNFQEQTVEFLTEKTTSSFSKKKIIVKSPTGSGKTITLVTYIEKFLSAIDPNRIFLWLTPGAGDLEEQSRKKMESIYPALKTGNIHNVILNGFVGGTTYFINWEMITNKNNRSLKDTEYKNLYNQISSARLENKKFIVVIDEEHLNNTSKADHILMQLNHDYEIRVSATAKKDNHAEYLEIPEEEVINSGLITQAMYINQGIEMESFDSFKTESKFLIDLAIEKHKEIKSEYDNLGLEINPLIIIQFPNNSDPLIDETETYLEEKGFSVKNKKVAMWFDQIKVNQLNVTDNNAESNFLFMKQAISTGWDCPRAKILVKLREGMAEDFEIQTLGRIRRMPEARHYENSILDFCFLYTFDPDYKEKVMSGYNAYEVKRLFLKEKASKVSFIKESRNHDFHYANELEVLNKIYDHFIEEYNLNSDLKVNENKMETYGYIFGYEVYTKYLSGKFRTLNEIVSNERNYNDIKYKVNTHDHGIEVLHNIDALKKEIGIPSKETKVILQQLFHKNIPSSKKILSLNNHEWYAFIINNIDALKGIFYNLAGHSWQLNLLSLPPKTETINLPEEVFYQYSPYESDITVYEKNAYNEYDSSMTIDGLRSTPEQIFEDYCEDNKDVDWYYNNGDSGKQYLSIVYETGFGKEYLFYPDYIVQLNNGEIWIIETKGGESYGVDKNIDNQMKNKFIAIGNYAEKYKVNWGFVRDRNRRLYFNNKEFVDDMSHENWKHLKDIF